MSQKHWLLPEDVIELLPEEAFKIEIIRRKVLDLMQSWGYCLVIPPLVEYLDSLLAGSGRDLDGQTFKITDQKSGRLMGVRADITPQIARIDAHRLPTTAESRYAYCGDVLRTRSESTEPRRNPLIIGAELFGVANVSGDVEIMALLLSILDALSIENSILDVGHAGIFAGLVQRYQLNDSARNELEQILQSKSRADVLPWQHRHQLEKACGEDVLFLLESHLQPNPVEAFQEKFAPRHPLFAQAAIELQESEKIQLYFPQQKRVFDLASVGSYGYHSGLLFSLYVNGHYGTVARGGRYDGVGKAYGHARPATGFSADLLTLAELMQGEYPLSVKVQSCPQTAESFAAVQTARAAGQMIRFQHEE